MKDINKYVKSQSSQKQRTRSSVDDVNKRVKSRREELNMSQDELAQRLGYNSRSTIAKIESGKNNIPQKRLADFAFELNTTVSWLLGIDQFIERMESSIHDFETLDAKAYFKYRCINEFIYQLGYKFEERFGTDENGDTTVVFEKYKSIEDNNIKFEIKQKDLDEFRETCASFMDYTFHKLIEDKNRVHSDFFDSFYNECKSIDEINE